MKKILPLIIILTAYIPMIAQDIAKDLWYQKPMRILQTVLRQPDAEHYNVDSLVQYMHMTHANTLVINGGGIVDYFQNRLPMANINPYIGSRDLLAEIVEGCHKASIKVIAGLISEALKKNVMINIRIGLLKTKKEIRSF
ncbi:MAG: hypothetical protein IPL46_27770 [Saprospiraceae bacterium]|nr:hypothetical protein [Saprospiraceae bacterium]